VLKIIKVLFFNLAYFSSKENVNIIGTDFSKMPMWNLGYIPVASNMLNLGQYIGKILQRILLEELKQSNDQIHIIGHSLGGHLAAFISRQMSKGEKKIQRVTGTFYFLGSKNILIGC